MGLEERDLEQDEQVEPEQTVNLPPPPFVPVGLPQDVSEREREAEEYEHQDELRRTG